MNVFSFQEKNTLRNMIAGAYNLEEMKRLCHDLGIEWENVGTQTTRNMFAQDIVNYCDRHGLLHHLLQQVQEDRSYLFNRPDYSNESQYVEESDDDENSNNIFFWGVLIAVVAIGAFFLFSWNSDRKLKEPSVFLTSYIDLLDRKYTSNAWEKLSGDYRINKHPTGFTPFSEYYFSFKKIEILKIEVLDETSTTSSVRVVLALTSQDNSIMNEDIIYMLSRPTIDDAWLIQDSNP